MSDPGRPRLLDEFQPALILDKSAAEDPKTGYWQDEDMDIDKRRKLIIGALDPRHDDEGGPPCTDVGTLSAKNRNPNCRSGFFVISYGNPRDCARSATSSSSRRVTPRAASTTATTCGLAARRGAMTSPNWRVSTGNTDTDSNSWDVAWRGNYVYLFDMNRGIEILRLENGGVAKSARMRKVTAPSLKRPARYKAVSSLESGDLVCPLFQ